MRVNGPGPTEPANKAKKKQNVGAGGFDACLSASAAGGGEAMSTTETAGLSDISGMSALLSLQELTGQGESNAKAYKHGEDILEQLSDLRMGLLSGLIPPEKLQNLATLIQGNIQETTDPQLREILNDIEVRARVELEKFNKASQAG